LRRPLRGGRDRVDFPFDPERPESGSRALIDLSGNGLPTPDGTLVDRVGRRFAGPPRRQPRGVDERTVRGELSVDERIRVDSSVSTVNAENLFSATSEPGWPVPTTPIAAM